jgi:ferredoxin-NADP reductase
MVASMLDEGSAFEPPSIRFLYSTKFPAKPGGAEVAKEKHKDKKKLKHAKEHSHILHLPTLLDMASSRPQLDLTLFLTNLSANQKLADPESLGWMHDRRIESTDLLAALGDDVQEREKTLVYVCGPPGMTDEIVAWFGRQAGMSGERVFCEKWW